MSCKWLQQTSRILQQDLEGCLESLEGVRRDKKLDDIILDMQKSQVKDLESQVEDLEKAIEKEKALRDQAEQKLERFGHTRSSTGKLPVFQFHDQSAKGFRR